MWWLQVPATQRRLCHKCSREVKGDRLAWKEPETRDQAVWLLHYSSAYTGPPTPPAALIPPHSVALPAAPTSQRSHPLLLPSGDRVLGGALTLEQAQMTHPEP